MKIVKLRFFDMPDWYEIVIGKKIMLAKLQCEGLQWSICGLGLTKAEREFFDSKFMKLKNIINIYLGKLIISYDKRGYREHCSSCDIVYEMPLYKWIKNRINNYIQYDLKRYINSKINKVLHKFFFKKQYQFVVERLYEPTRVIKTDMLTAYQLAVNYEADLLLNGSYILSCLGFGWEENNDLIQKHLGRFFRLNRLFGYADYSCIEIIR